MPGMRLDFLKNTAQRSATGKSMPLKQVEAIILYGKPEQRAKVIQKLLPSTYVLCLSKATHYILLALLEKADGLVRVQMLYHVRRKILDLSLSPVGNIIIQEMLQKLPPQQKKEMAEAFVLNTEEDELRRLCEHPFGNHVAQKLVEFPASREVVEDRFLPFIPTLAVHPYGQRVVAKYIEYTEQGWRRVVKAIFGIEEGEVDEDRISPLFESQNESMVLTALLRHPLVATGVKDAIYAHLCEYVVDYLQDPGNITDKKNEEVDEFPLPDFGGANDAKNTVVKKGREDEKQPLVRHYHSYVAIFEHGDAAQRIGLWGSLVAVPGLVEHIVSHRTAIAVAIAAFKTLPEAQEQLWSLLFASSNGQQDVLSICDVAQDPVRTLLLRAVMEVRGDFLTKVQRRELSKAALELSQNPVSSPVLQKLVECFADDGEVLKLVWMNVKDDLRKLVNHSAASYFIQAMLQYGTSELREDLAKALLVTFDDLHEMLSFAQASRVMQKLVAYASDDVVMKVIDQMLNNSQRELDVEVEDEVAEERQEEEKEEEEEEEKEEEEEEEEKEEQEEEEEEEKEEEGENKENGDTEKKTKDAPAKKLTRHEQREINRAKHYQVASHAIVSYALHHHACYVIQALLRECRGRRLETHRKRLLNELKPFVFDLSVSPWAGRVVLDTMMQSGSAQLAEAMKNVVFLRAEAWLTDVSAEKKRRGGGLDPTMRQTLRRDREGMSEAARDSSPAAETKHPRKKMYRSLKK